MPAELLVLLRTKTKSVPFSEFTIYIQYIVVMYGIRIIGIIMKGNGLALSDDEIFPLTGSFVLYTSHTQIPIIHHEHQTLNLHNIIVCG